MILILLSHTLKIKIHMYMVYEQEITNTWLTFSPLVRDMDLGSSMMADKLTYELCNTVSEFALEGLAFWPLVGVIYGSNYGVIPLFSW